MTLLFEHEEESPRVLRSDSPLMHTVLLRDRWTLSLGVLRGLAGALEAGLLALFGPRVSGEETGLAENRPGSLVGLHQRSGGRVDDRPGLARDTAAFDLGEH